MTSVQVCFLNCLVWNYWEECLEHTQMPINPNAPTDFELYKVKVRHRLACLD